MLSSLRRKQAASSTGRSASAEPKANSQMSETDRRRLSSPITGTTSTKEFAAADDDADFGDSEQDDSTERSKTTNGKGGNRLSLSLNNGNLNKIAEDASVRPGTSNSARREPARHPHRISEEQEADLSRASMNGRASFSKEEDIPATHPTQAWRAAAARIAAKETEGELRKLRPSSNENTNSNDRQAALNSLMGSLDTRSSNGSAEVGNRFDKAPLNSDSIYTAPNVSHRETSVYGNVYGLDTDARDDYQPKPKSPSSPSKTTFPRGQDGFDASAAPPMPPLPSITAQASSSQETLSHYLTPKSSFYNEKEAREEDYAPAYLNNEQDGTNGNAGVLGAVQNTFNMFARGIMPGKFPGSQPSSAAISQKSSTETLRNVAVGQALDLKKVPVEFPPGATAPPLTGNGKIANWREVVAEEVRKVGGVVEDDSDDDDLISLAGNSIYETADEYMSGDDDDDVDMPTRRNTVQFEGVNMPILEIQQQRWDDDSDADSDDTINEVKVTRSPAPPHAPSPPRSSMTPSPLLEDAEEDAEEEDIKEAIKEDVAPSPPTPVRHSPPSTPSTIKPKPILKRPDSSGLQRTVSSQSSSSSVKSVTLYNNRISEEGADSRRLTQTKEEVSEVWKPVALPPASPVTANSGAKKLRKEPINITPAANGTTQKPTLVAQKETNTPTAPATPVSKPRTSIFRKFTSEKEKPQSKPNPKTPTPPSTARPPSSTNTANTTNSNNTPSISTTNTNSTAPSSMSSTGPTKVLVSSTPTQTPTQTPNSSTRHRHGLSSLSFPTLRSSMAKERDERRDAEMERVAAAAAARNGNANGNGAGNMLRKKRGDGEFGNTIEVDGGMGAVATKKKGFWGKLMRRREKERT